MSVERTGESRGERGELGKKDRFIDHFDSYTRRKILTVAARFSHDLERLLFMLDREPDSEEPLTRDELLSFLPKETKKAE